VHIRDLPYAPLADAFLIYPRKSPLQRVADVIADPSYFRVERIGTPIDAKYAGTPPATAVHALGFGPRGQRVCADLPQGNYIAVWKMGAQGRAHDKGAGAPSVAIEFTVNA
jgi:hypothetical protein